MNDYTNTGLVNHAKKALALKTKYMWAGTLNLITDAYITQKVKQCADGGVPASRTGYTAARIKTLRSLAGKGYYGVDCVCLIKSYLWGGIGCPKYKGEYDLPAGSMYERAKVKGKIDTLPECPGVIVISRKNGNHVGVYIGNGKTIESTLGSRGDGVVKHKLDKTFWTDWFECPYIEYPKTAKTVKDPECGNAKAVTLAFRAAVRAEPRNASAKLAELQAGTKCAVLHGSEKTDSKTGYKYIQLADDPHGWIVTTAIKK